jgi:hypothetical protein
MEFRLRHELQSTLSHHWRIQMPPSPKKYRIPQEFLKAFQGDLRFVPQVPHVNGWMTIDYEMIIAALRNGDPAVREKCAAAIGALKEQWEMVLVGKEDIGTVR